MAALTGLWLQLLACLLLIGVAGYRISLAAEVIAARTGFSRSWVGLILLATVTSLPELVTGISAVTLADAPILPLVTFLAVVCSISY